ncbi:MAG TPA: ABC transporter ATP-binding protein, partial [Anaerolineaceae bacterium]|nr:ABC transporter ATP-binding protein [Anaerolineaceae bacterium]
GRSGSGKSTLVNMLTGIDHPTRGSVRVADKSIHKLRESDMAVWRGRNLGIVFQFFQLLPTLSLLENVMLPMDFCGLYPPAEREPRALELLALVGLEKYAHKMPGAVSGGQQQSVAVARALANDPPILIADEPTGNLDGRTAEQVMQLFEQQVTKGKTVIMVTHDRDLARRAQRILVIADGELVNEALPKAFPEMRHRDLLALTRSAVSVFYSPEDVIEPFTGSQDRLCLVRSGEMQVWQRQWLGRKEKLVEILGPGAWVNRAQMQSWGAVTLKAGNSGLELLEMPVDGIKLPEQTRRNA